MVRTHLSFSVWLSGKTVRKKQDSHRWQFMQAAAKSTKKQFFTVHIQTVNKSGGAP
jgi:hypothetical protein